MRRVLSWIERIINGVSSFLLVLVTVVLSIQVFARYVLNSSTVWSEELARYSIVWLALLTLGVVIRRAEDIRVDFMDHLLTTRPLRVGVGVFLKLLEIAFMVVLIVSAVRLIPAAHSQMITGLKVPLSYVVWSFVVGPALTLPFLIERIVDIASSNTDS
jgi:TRAP-type C4-dicarboxylate transport system permease small subunit